MPPGFDDIFAQAFGGHNPFENLFGRRQYQQQQPKNKTLNIQTAISLEDAYNGKDLIASVTLPSGREQVIQVKIPAGIQDGTTLRLSGMGDDSINNVARGDINLTVNVQPHNIFKRQGDDLVKDIEISAIDAMLGTSVTVETIDNKLLEVNIPAGTQYGSTLSGQGYGMPHMHDNRFKGRLLLNIKIFIPKDLNEEQKELLRKSFK
jgi:DnaJ-class molecular chaperone